MARQIRQRSRPVGAGAPVGAESLLQPSELQQYMQSVSEDSQLDLKLAKPWARPRR